MKYLNVVAKQHLLDPEEEQRILARIFEFMVGVSPWFERKIRQHWENARFYWGEQWTDEETEAHLMQSRYPYVFDEILRLVDHLIGMQIQTRLDTRCVAREKSDEAQCDLLSFIVKWVEQTNNMEFVESKVFLSGLIGGAGCACVRWEREDIAYGYPKVEYVPIDQMMWDITSKEETLEDCRRMARRQLVQRSNLQEMFPMWVDEIEDMPAGYSTPNYVDHYDSDSNMMRSKYTKIISERAYDLVELVEYYEKYKTYNYLVSDEISGNINEFDTKQDADDFYDGLITEYTKQQEVLLNPDGSERIQMTMEYEITVWQTIKIGTKIFSHVPIALPDFPYVIYFAYFLDGYYWGFVENMKSPQIFMNRLVSQMEFQLGSSTKNLLTVIPDMLFDRNVEKIRRELSKTAPLVAVKSHEALHAWANTPINPEYFNLVNFSIGRMNDYLGGKNFTGLQENANESGRAVVARAEQGGLGKLPLFDRLRLWRKNITWRIVWFAKNFMPPGQIIRIIGKDEDIQYLNIDDGLLDSLQEVKIDVEVEEAVKSDTMNERYFGLLKEAFSVMPGVPDEIKAEIMLQYLPIPQSKKREIGDMIDFYKAYQQQKNAQQHQEQLTQEVQDSITKRAIKEQIDSAQQLQQQTQQADKTERSLKTKLDSIEKLQDQVKEQNAGLEDLTASADKLTTPTALGQATTAPIIGSMMR